MVPRRRPSKKGQQEEPTTESPNAWFQTQIEALSDIVQFGSRTIANTRAEHLKDFKGNSALLAALHLLSRRDSAAGESRTAWTTAMHAVDQRLRRWQSKPKAWLQLLQQVFGRSAPIEFNGISVEILDGHTMPGLHGAYTHADTKGKERIYLNADWLNSASATEVEAVLLPALPSALMSPP